MAQLWFFTSIAFQLHRVGDCRRSVCLAGTPLPAAGRSVAASARRAQLSLHRVIISRSGGCIA